eukprot:TRINITY_DN50725_c0_g1_i5.p2 TRINITY_DN50725_c0_g1~~TRINITY_DN50725_c0_g1_i5.p2  ORF type:complete len:415 (+),score=84.57 TRINITY_DN50725_c0_g1_i5:520-1764(+)
MRAGETIVAERMLEGVAERVVEKSEAVIERGVEAVAARAMEHGQEKVGERIIEHGIGRAVLKTGEQTGMRAGETIVAERILEGVAERVVEKSEAVIERGVEAVAARAVEHGQEKVGERIIEHGIGRAVLKTGEQTGMRAGETIAAERILEGVAERVVEKSEAVIERGVEAVAARAVEHGQEKVGERIIEHGIGRAIIEHGIGRAVLKTGEQTGEKVLERVGEATLRRQEMAARQLEQISKLLYVVFKPLIDLVQKMGKIIGRCFYEPFEGMIGQAAKIFSKFLGREPGQIGVRAFTRIGRGIAVAIPALGALLVLHLTLQDRQRMRKEFGQGSFSGGVAFLVAYLMDMLDVLAHVVIIVGLLEHHFQIGFVVSHKFLEVAEYGGLMAAVIATLAAVVGELVSSRLQISKVVQAK